MGRRLVKIILSRPSLIAAGLFGLYLVFGFFLVNPLAQKLLPWLGETRLASRLSAERVDFNPVTLEATVHGLKLTEPNGAPLAGFDRLYVDFDSTGLFRWAWRIRTVQLDHPRASIEVRPGGELNWAALIAKLQEDKKPPSDTIARVLIDHIRVDGGAIEYSDADRPGEPFKTALAPLDVELAGLSTLPEDRGDYLIAARLPEQGGTLKWKGDIGLNPVASQGEVALEGVRLNNLLRALKGPRNFELPSGTAGAGLRYRFALVRDPSGADVPWLQIEGANLIVRDLALAPRGGAAPVLQLAEARVSDASFDLAGREVKVAAVSLADGRLAATRDIQGVLDWQTLFGVAENGAAAEGGVVPKAAPPKAAAPVAPWKIAVREIRLANWAARFTDQGFAQPLRVDVEGFGLSAALAGEVGATAAIDVGPVNGALGPVRVHSGSQPVAQLQRAALVNGGLKLAENRLVIEAVELSGAKTTVALDKKRNLNWTAILEKAPGAPAAAPAKAATAAPMDVRVARLSLDGVEVGIVDHSPGKPVGLDVAQGFVTLKDVSLDMNRAVPLEAGFSLRQGGRLDASGTVIPGKASGRLDLKLAGLSLRPFAPYVNQFARLELHSGELSTRGRLAFEQAKTGVKLDFGGGFVVDDLAITEEETAEAFLGWKRLSTASLQVRLAPDALRMKELVALNPFGKVIIYEDQSINLKRILRTGAQDARPKESARPAMFPVAIERLRIVDANAEFADLSLTPQFGTRMHGLGGVVTGLSTDPATVALVELDGRVDEFGSARVRGSIQPFRATEFTDLKLSFRNLEMTRLTPYSGKFAGRKIDSGRLSVDLEYRIKQRQLTADNKFIVNKLKLGERVESPSALKLPLDLAIALLEDSNGVIDLDLPVSGSLDDPQFSYGGIIWKAFVNVLTRLVTAPFRALGNLLGVSAEKLEAIEFDPGSSVLLPPEQEKLKTVVDALARRPALILTLEPGYDPDADRRALQELAMRREAAAVAGITLAPDEAPGPVDVNHSKIQTWLEDRYAELAGRSEYQKLRADYRGKDAGVVARMRESELVERLGRRFKTRDPGPVSAFHAELLERLTRLTKIDDDALVKLAQARAQVMREALVNLGLDAGRIAMAAPAEQSARDKMVASKMGLEAGSRPGAGPGPQPSGL